jgi:hypothetical protein
LFSIFFQAKIQKIPRVKKWTNFYPVETYPFPYFLLTFAAGKIKIISMKVILIALFSMISIAASAQYVSVAGVVKDAETGEPMPFVAVRFIGVAVGTQTNDKGAFSMSNNLGVRTITVSSLGYKEKTITVDGDKVSDLAVLLEPTDFLLDEVVVRNGREHYTKRKNPAVEFMREVIARKNGNRIESKPFYQSELYEKFTLHLDKFNPDSKLFKKNIFLSNAIDSSEVNGRKVLTLSMKETLTDIYYSKTPRTKKEVVKAIREEGILRDFDESTSHNLQELLREINLYDNSVELMYNSFVSPLSSTLAIATYKYYIEDTVAVDSVQCLKMFFSPFNKQSIGFNGRLYITLDGKYSLKKAELHIPNQINLNFTKDLTVIQNFTQLTDSTWALAAEDLFVNLYLFNGIPELLLHRVKSIRNYSFDSHDNTFYSSLKSDMEEDEKAIKKSTDYWAENRHIPLRQKEETGLGKMLAELRRHPLYKTIVRTSDFFSSGYFVAGGNRDASKFNVGPLTSLVSINEIEGLHLRLGGTTTAKLFKRLFASGYVAYGIYDQKLKYNGKLTYSFRKKKFHENEFPRNNLSLMYEYDLYSPGAVFQEDKDNFFAAWKVGAPVTKMSYLRRGILAYEKDLNFNFRTKMWLKYQIDEPTGTLKYQLNSSNSTIADLTTLTTFEWGAQLSCTFGGRPYNGRNPQMNLAKSVTEFSLSHYAGFKDVLGSLYNYQRTEIEAKTRLKMTVFGYIDTRLTAGKVWTKTPFPMLIIPNAYQSILIQPNAFQLMNALEFVTDQYVGLNVEYHLNGLLFNRIPIFNLLKLREVASFNGIYGSLANRNNPQATDGLFLLPNGTKPLGNAPFMEASIGIENIFKVFRVDYFRRLNYIDASSSKWGFRASFNFIF